MWLAIICPVTNRIVAGYLPFDSGRIYVLYPREKVTSCRLFLLTCERHFDSKVRFPGLIPRPQQFYLLFTPGGAYVLAKKNLDSMFVDSKFRSDGLVASSNDTATSVCVGRPFHLQCDSGNWHSDTNLH